MSMDVPSDSFNLQRYVLAVAPHAENIRAELAEGKKRSHWMWFVFPQLKALGRSATALHFGLVSADEALAYWQHPQLGPWLQLHTGLVCAFPLPRTAHDIFRSPDDLKFHSCMTLFAQVAPEEPLFRQCLQRYFNAEPDHRTLVLLTSA